MSFKINRTRPEPIHQQISEWMRQQITAGLWPEHYKLKSETELVTELGVNRGTVRKAIAALIAEGLLVTVHGRGTFVVSQTLEQSLADGLIAISEDLLHKGIPFETQVLEQTVVPASQRVAALLAVPQDTRIFMLRRVRSVRQEPFTLIRNYLLYDRLPQIERVDFTRQRLFETLEKQFNLRLSWGQRTFQAQVADEAIARLLHISPCDPVMYIEQVTYLRDGSPIELSDVWLRGDQVRLSAMVKRDETSHTDKGSHKHVGVHVGIAGLSDTE